LIHISRPDTNLSFLFSSASEAINAALRKAYARKSRTYLRWLMKKEGITEEEMLRELESFRR
jgi:Arc/MetJ-type ribon-helix-helix transcriptional regulator